MNSSTKIDVNYLSCSNNVWGLDEGSDHPSVSQPPIDGKVIPTNPKDYASALKLCDNSVVTLTDLEVAQCNECAVDINNHATVDLKGRFGSSVDNFGNQTFSIKGGSNAKITGILRGIGNRGCDVLVDNWSDQSYNSSLVDLSTSLHEQGRKIKVVSRLLSSKVVGNNIEKLYLKSAELTIYWWVKWLIRKALGIKVGQKGPSWF